MSLKILRGWYVILLRPALTRGALVRAVTSQGGHPVCIPGLRLQAAADPQVADQALACALRAPLVLVTSPAAVHFARRLPSWRRAADTRFAAVGGGSAQALRRAGARDVIQPISRQDSDGLLQHPVLQDDMLASVGLLTAPGGRGRLIDVLGQRGVSVCRADVYRRLPPRLDRRHLHALDAIDGPSALLHSSAEALVNLQVALPSACWHRLIGALLIPSSARLAAQARELGFQLGPTAESATAIDMVDALIKARTGVD
ncbi:MAG: uroporphyrinogen-III synthase [Xanthomonadales bacterium]|nr:uroporphyrinogen-III synthase [Xanthomonadales bacterium]